MPTRKVEVLLLQSLKTWHHVHPEDVSKWKSPLLRTVDTNADLAREGISIARSYSKLLLHPSFLLSSGESSNHARPHRIYVSKEVPKQRLLEHQTWASRQTKYRPEESWSHDSPTRRPGELARDRAKLRQKWKHHTYTNINRSLRKTGQWWNRISRAFYLQDFRILGSFPQSGEASLRPEHLGSGLDQPIEADNRRGPHLWKCWVRKGWQGPSCSWGRRKYEWKIGTRLIGVEAYIRRGRFVELLGTWIRKLTCRKEEQLGRRRSAEIRQRKWAQWEIRKGDRKKSSSGCWPFNQDFRTKSVENSVHRVMKHVFTKCILINNIEILYIFH